MFWPTYDHAIAYNVVVWGVHNTYCFIMKVHSTHGTWCVPRFYKMHIRHLVVIWAPNAYNMTREIFFDSKCVLKRAFGVFRKTSEELGSKNTSVKKLSKKIA